MALRQTLLNQVRTKRKAMIPHIAKLRVKTLRARPAGKRMLLGQEIEVKARAASEKIVCSALKAFHADCFV